MVSFHGNQGKYFLISAYLGRSLAIVPRSYNESGYMDIEHDDYPEVDFLSEWQDTVLSAAHRISVSNITTVTIPSVISWRVDKQ